ncbi:MAG: DUF488 family protein [Candidatus Dadabacteria bacterium]|nr:DUF488 family protein [Candidatus Dadabacteria bacterium]
MIKIRRVYDSSDKDEGLGFLIDRLWPRGVKKGTLQMEGWLKDAAPSDALRRWFKHDPKKWDKFRHRYFAELDSKREVWQPLLKAARKGTITLLYSARDREHNNALALKEYLKSKLKK